MKKKKKKTRFKERLTKMDIEKLKEMINKKKGGLSEGQKKIAAKAPPTNKIDGKDFAVLRAEKAKGRGMGLQDEKVKPGKVMKAKKGTFAGYSKVFETAAKAGEKNIGTSTIVGVKPNPKKSVAKSKRVTYKSMDEMRQKTLGYKPGESTEAFKKRKANEAFAKRAASATGVRGKIALGVAAAGVGAYNYLKSKMKKKEEPKKKMGGGMMKVPGYSSGTSVRPRIILTDPDTPKGPKAGRPKAPPPPRKRRLPQQARRSSVRGAGLGALGGTGNDVKPKLKVVIIGGSKKSLTGQGGLERDAENKPYRYSYSTDPMLQGATIVKSSSRTGGGMMNKPMGYKSGKSIKVKCKLGKNKPTKMY